MSFFDGLTPTYTFRLQIERSDRPILDTEITVKGTPDEIAKAKKSVQRLLADHTPTVKARSRYPPRPRRQTPRPCRSRRPRPPPPNSSRTHRRRTPSPGSRRRGRGGCFASAARSAAIPSGPSSGSTRRKWAASAATS